MSIAGPAWDLSSEYTDLSDPGIATDLAHIDAQLAVIAEDNARLAPTLDAFAAAHTNQPMTVAAAAADTPEALALARRIHWLLDDVTTHLSNLSTYASCLLSVDGRNQDALRLQGTLERRSKQLSEVAQLHAQFLKLAPETAISRYLDDPATRASSWQVERMRAQRHELLNLGEETLVGALSTDGIHAWGKLYTQLSATTTCTVTVGNEQHAMGLAAAAGLMMKPDDATRRNAWQAINTAWTQNEESCAAALNAIAGWRLEMVRKRSLRKPVHFLDAPLHANSITRATLDALLSVAAEAAPLARRAALAQAKAYGKEKYGPWDNRAPAPTRPGASETVYPFDDALALIARTYGGIDPEMGEFVTMMGRNRWIEGTVGNAKRPGAYQTAFRKSRTPRIYMTYTGATSDVITLAHELGHAYHSWVMRDLANDECGIGMSVAETASTFGEAIVREALLTQAQDPAQAFAIAWQDAEAAIAFILNIPARFEFERNFYEQRSERPLQLPEIKQLMSSAWSHWYGEALAEPDTMFWASKLHFFISGLSFYNFPYLFGYLFSLGIYAQREKLGADFFPAYKALLRDTGRMSAEALAARHLNADLTQPQFWRDSVQLVSKSVSAFEALSQRQG